MPCFSLDGKLLMDGPGACVRGEIVGSVDILDSPSHDHAHHNGPHPHPQAPSPRPPTGTGACTSPWPGRGRWPTCGAAAWSACTSSRSTTCWSRRPTPPLSATAARSARTAGTRCGGGYITEEGPTHPFIHSRRMSVTAIPTGCVVTHASISFSFVLPRNAPHTGGVEGVRAREGGRGGAEGRAARGGGVQRDGRGEQGGGGRGGEAGVRGGEHLQPLLHGRLHRGQGPAEPRRCVPRRQKKDPRCGVPRPGGAQADGGGERGEARGVHFRRLPPERAHGPAGGGARG